MFIEIERGRRIFLNTNMLHYCIHIFLSNFYVLLLELFIFLCFLKGMPVTQNVSWGVIISTRSLVLQRVGRYHSGMYACAAANDRGETQSALVSLRIHCEYIFLKHFFQLYTFHVGWKTRNISLYRWKR